MALLTGSVITEIQALLNDPTGSIYPTVALMPLLNKAYRELQVKLGSFGVGTTREVIKGVPLPVGTKVLDDGNGLPTDFLYPVELGERLAGSGAKYTLMVETEWESDKDQQDLLFYWSWREESIKFVGALTDRELLIRYYKSLVPLTDTTTPIQISESQTWLAQRTASIAALLLGSNPSRAEALMQDLYGSQGPWEDLKSTKVKRLQNIPVRRRRTRWRVA
jgi:hypothetical protein